MPARARAPTSRNLCVRNVENKRTDKSLKYTRIHRAPGRGKAYRTVNRSGAIFFVCVFPARPMCAHITTHNDIMHPGRSAAVRRGLTRTACPGFISHFSHPVGDVAFNCLTRVHYPHRFRTAARRVTDQTNKRPSAAGHTLALGMHASRVNTWHGI